MARARQEAISMVQAFRIMKHDSNIFIIKDWTKAQIMFFIIYAATLLIVIPSEIFLRLFKPTSYQTIKMQDARNKDENPEQELVTLEISDPQATGKTLLDKKKADSKPIHKASPQ